MTDESDQSRQDLGVDTTSGTQVYQTLPWGRGWHARLDTYIRRQPVIPAVHQYATQISPNTDETVGFSSSNFSDDWGGNHWLLMNKV